MRRSQDLSLAAIASEFHTNVERVRQAVRRVEAHDRGVVMLRADPTSPEALDLIGELPTLVRLSLAEHGIVRLDDLQRHQFDELLRLPNIGTKSIVRLRSLWEKYRSTTPP